MSLDLPAAAEQHPSTTVDTAALQRALTERVDGEVRFDNGSRAAYAASGATYRQVPICVVVPRSVEAGAEAATVAREHDAPLLSRGGGTSLAGQCCNVAVVIDWSKYCDRVLSVDVDERTAIVEPGVVLDNLNERTRAEGGLIFGPKPSTHDRCTIGGMLGNDSCGSTSQAYGKAADNVVSLEILTYDGCRMWVGATSEADYEDILAQGGRRADIYRRLRALSDRHARAIERRFPDIPRRVSGYNLDSLLPQNGFDLARALVGSEGTLATILRAKVRLVPEPPARDVVVLGYRDIFAAGDAAAGIAAYEPLAIEGVDDKLIDYQRRKRLNPEARKLLPEGAGWLMVQFGGETRAAVRERAQRFVDEISASEHAPTVRYYDNPRNNDDLWKLRESALGATALVPGERDTWEGWEDSAVAPERFGEYLRDLHALLTEFGYAQRAAFYGHFGHGCLHTRIPFELSSHDGVERYREFVERAADLVVSYRGSFSGEHGDGQSRAELWPKMFGDELMAAFAAFKRVFDPDDRMNPGKLVRPDGTSPYRLDDNLRFGPEHAPAQPATFFAYPDDEGDFSHAALRCVGVGKCRHDSGGVMCPSYRVTREEEHSTRGRARLLFEMVDGQAITDGWRSTEVGDALDLCLACKGCKSDCPVNVDMATYKAEFLAHHYEGRLRPAAHYSMGWLPALARAASLAPGVVNTLTGRPSIAAIAKRLAGIAPERPIPEFAPVRFRDAFRRRTARTANETSQAGERGEVILWPDTFTDNFQPGVGAAAVRVLEAAGFRVRVPRRTLCCGLTWISTGQLSLARRVLQQTVAALREDLRAGIPVIGLEPSCAAVFRSDAPELFPDDPDVARLRDTTFTLAEFLNSHAAQWQPPAIGNTVLAQPHCHHHAIMGYDADQELLRRAGAAPHVLDVGCCGLAGNFGFERDHFSVSMACAEDGLLPAVRGADSGAFVLADGFSCRTQIDHAGVGRRAVHLAEALDLALRGAVPRERPERASVRFGPGRRATMPSTAELRRRAVEAGQRKSSTGSPGSRTTG
ncbi:FAD-binding and (Fe-S)-binding domain-containing protein [Salinactinospora qingdaonensis]|uniref:FAD-binding and (Fe-S)-binding domain-containing protein n=1 Tax=Salinactinospora qingdaonensis TaxID=702744 RepID=A0ABP7FIL6_9ACTN